MSIACGLRGLLPGLSSPGLTAGTGGEISARGEAAMANARQLADAHRRLLADGDVQFDLLPPPVPPRLPAWLSAFYDWLGDVLSPVGKLIRWSFNLLPDAPYARLLLGILLVTALLWLGRLIYLHFHALGRPARSVVDGGEEPDALPDAITARSWLEEADALAAQSRYGDAVHHLLIRSIEDIDRRRPQVLGPSLTSRDIAAIEGIPAGPRAMFARIAAVVEASLFGGQPVGAEQWAACRAAYDDFAERRLWAR